MLITFLVHPLLHVMWRPWVSGLEVRMDQGAWPRAAETAGLWRAQVHIKLCEGQEGGWA